MLPNPDFCVRRLETDRVLKLCRCPIEDRLETPLVERSLPATVEDEKQIVTRLENPADATLQARQPRFVVVLHQVGPGEVGADVVVRFHSEDVSLERSG